MCASSAMVAPAMPGVPLRAGAPQRGLSSYPLLMRHLKRRTVCQMDASLAALDRAVQACKELCVNCLRSRLGVYSVSCLSTLSSKHSFVCAAHQQVHIYQREEWQCCRRCRCSWRAGTASLALGPRARVCFLERLGHRSSRCCRQDTAASGLASVHGALDVQRRLRALRQGGHSWRTLLFPSTSTRS